MPRKGANVSLSSYDDIFSTEQSRTEAGQEHVQEIPLEELHPFEGHPFKVLDNEEMVCMWIMDVVEAISTNLRYKNRDMNEEQLLDFTDAVPETYEDKYYMALQSLYNTYCIR